MIERQEAAVKFLVSHQQFAKAVKPTVRDFDNTTFCLLLRVTLEFAGLLPTALDMSNVATHLNDRQRRCNGVAGIGAQVFGPSD